MVSPLEKNTFFSKPELKTISMNMKSPYIYNLMILGLLTKIQLQCSALKPHTQAHIHMYRMSIQHFFCWLKTKRKTHLVYQ